MTDGATVYRQLGDLRDEVRFATPIPPAVISAIRAAPNRAIFNVSSNEIYTGQVLKCDELVLSQDAILTMTSLTDQALPWAAIVARRWKFLAPQRRAIIRRDLTEAAPQGGAGGPGNGGPPGPEDNAGGGAGGQGGQGQTGGSMKIPLLYLFGERMIDQPGNPIPWMNLLVLLPGIMGGTGGVGGIGGNGGDGAQGNPGSDGPLWCNRGPGDGGPGGDGGRGGTGGQGGQGGDGGRVVYAGPRAFLDIITFANLINVPGDGGLGGQGGRGGQGGSGGPRGANTTYCHGGSRGRDGSNGRFGNVGPDGPSGQKGSADVSPRNNLGDVYRAAASR